MLFNLRFSRYVVLLKYLSKMSLFTHNPTILKYFKRHSNKNPLLCLTPTPTQILLSRNENTLQGASYNAV